jgi:hypothetical protein
MKKTAAALQLVADRHSLTADETVLLAVCHSALSADIEHIAAMCRLSRVSEEQTHLHGSEIGVGIELRPAMVLNIRRFALFFYTLHNLTVVEFEGALPNRTLLGYQGITIKHKSQWISVINSACDTLKYFGPQCSKVTVYERLLDFGYGPRNYTPRVPGNYRKRTSSEKKISMLLDNPYWSFMPARLDRNVKRLTNGHVKQEVKPCKQEVKPCKLDMLLQVALRVDV